MTFFRLRCLLCILAPAFVVVAGEPPVPLVLTARLNTVSRHDLRVLRVERGVLHLQPADGGTGEVMLPLDEARDLQFVLPESYGRARQLALQGQPAEARALLAPLATALVSFVGAPKTNARPVVQAYLDLLVRLKEYDEALALGQRLPLAAASNDFAPLITQLATALVYAGRSAEATRLMTQLPAAEEVDAQRVETVADVLRRAGHFAEAAVLYERLPVPADEATQWHRERLLAYVELRSGMPLKAGARLERIPAEEQDHPLYLLLSGELLLAAKEIPRALDQLGRAVVRAGGGSEWHHELIQLTASAYEASGRVDVAAALRADLQLLRTASLAIRSAALPPVADNDSSR